MVGRKYAGVHIAPTRRSLAGAQHPGELKTDAIVLDPRDSGVDDASRRRGLRRSDFKVDGLSNAEVTRDGDREAD